MFVKREEIKNILDREMSDEEKKELISNIITVNTDIGRVISINENEVNDFLNLEIGSTLTNIGHSWQDRNDENIGNFMVENVKDVDILFQADNVSGYKLQYFNERLINDYDLLDELLENEVYESLMWLLGSDEDMHEEAEVLVSNNKEFIVQSISDERDESGYIIIKLA